MKKYLNASERNVIGWGLRHEFSIGKIAEGLKRAKSMVIMKLKNVAILIFQKRCDWQLKTILNRTSKTGQH